MENEKEEFIKETSEIGSRIKCAELTFGKGVDRKSYFLPIDYTDKELNEFLTSIDFKYKNGFGSQYLFGHI